MKLALDPTEWEQNLSGGYSDPYDRLVVEEGQTVLDRDWPAVGYDSGYARQVIADRHAAAALCLHGQPFGFTWKDVDALRWALEFVMPPDGDDRSLALRSLADRVGALLPPRP